MFDLNKIREDINLYLFNNKGYGLKELKLNNDIFYRLNDFQKSFFSNSKTNFKDLFSDLKNIVSNYSNNKTNNL